MLFPTSCDVRSTQQPQLAAMLAQVEAALFLVILPALRTLEEPFVLLGCPERFLQEGGGTHAFQEQVGHQSRLAV